ncbi:hypothetical protein PHYPSEUDO_013114 [Phytophthora pseudosyringae]|uniref:Uncharacterized protein n=1 Tax=Phytophthora pseudosyringae TaxID=221518 RepID=A0A8T1V5R9_9STRA|nr:hypothetical protein PHYPSEUDO_013114 [Phytophthora pseudosyringae]
MQYRTVKAQENLFKSLSYKVDVVKEQLRVNQAHQRLQEEQALHVMINELFSSKPTSLEHAAYLEKRREGLLRRLDALGEKSSQPPPTPAGVMPPPSQQDATPTVNEDSTPPSPSTKQQDATPPIKADSAPPSPSNPSPLSSVLPTPENACPSSPVILDSSTTSFTNVSSSFSPTPSSMTTASFPPLTQPSQAHESITGLRVLDV